MSVLTAESDLATKLSAAQQPLIIASGSIFLHCPASYTCRGILVTA